MKKSDLIYLLTKNLKDYSEMDVSLSADLIQKSIIDSLKKEIELKLEVLGHFV